MKIHRAHHLLAASLATALSPLAPAEIIFSTFINANEYQYAVYDMPDFDQRRLGDLPGNGSCHCGPTSVSDILAYVATHGYPEYDPGLPFFASWESNLNYNAATAIINEVGVNTNNGSGAGNASCGTSSNSLFNELTARLSDKFIVGLDGSPNVEKIALRGVNNAAIGLILYGRFDGAFDAFGTFQANNRAGGHFEPVSVAMETSTMRRLAVRNPAGFDSPMDAVQSGFGTEWFDVTTRGMSWNNGPAFGYDQLGPALFNGTRVLRLQSHVWVAPKMGFAWDEYTPNSFVSWIPELPQWAPRFDPRPVPLPYVITDLQPVNGMNAYAAIIEREFVLIDQVTGEFIPLAPLPPDPIVDLEVDRFGQIHLAAGNSVISINPEPKIHTALPMPGEVISIAAASSMQTTSDPNTVPVAYALIAEPSTLAVIFATRDGYQTEFLALDSTMIINPDSMIVAMPNHLCLLSNGRLQTFKLDVGPVNLELLAIDQPLTFIRDMVADDQNVLLLSGEGETTYNAFQLRDRYVDADWHPLHRAETPGRLAVMRSQSSVAPWNDPMNESNQYDESDRGAVSETVSDCRSDLNFDGKVDGADMGILLAEWDTDRSIADISRDGTVDGADLGLLLGAFGDCP